MSSTEELYASAKELIVLARKPRFLFKRFLTKNAEIKNNKAFIEEVIIIATRTLSRENDQATKEKILDAAKKHIGLKSKQKIFSIEEAVKAGRRSIARRKSPKSAKLDLQKEIETTIAGIQHVLEKNSGNKNTSALFQANISKSILSLKNKLMQIETVSTRHDYISRARTALIKTFGEDEIVLPYTQQLKDEAATAYLKTRYEKRVVTRKKYALEVNTFRELIAICEKIIANSTEPEASQNQWAKLAVALALATGRRITEICYLSSFEQTGAYEITMTGVAKQKNEVDKETREITFPTLIPALLILNGIEQLRKIKDFTVFKGDYREFASSTNTPLKYACYGKNGTSVSPIFGTLFNFKITPKQTRQLYAAFILFEMRQKTPTLTDNESDSALAKIMGHFENDLLTVQSYKDFMVYKKGKNKA